MSKNKSLFQEFSPVSLTEWEEKISKDLKGKPLSVLENETNEGFTFPPYFTKENSTDYTVGNSVEKRKEDTESNSWNMDKTIKVLDAKKANKLALKSLLEGVNSITFKGDLSNLSILLENVMIEIITLNFISKNPIDTILQLQEICTKQNLDFNEINGSISFDFLTDFAKNKKGIPSNSEGFSTLNSFVKNNLENKLKTIAIGTCMYQKSGANCTQQIAIGLSKGVEYLNYLTENFEINKISDKITFHFAVGNDYFIEIAKLRAFRLLWSQILKSFGAKNTATTINVTTSTLLWAEKDIKNNMLRATSQAMSAVTGGCDSLNILPFDTNSETTENYSERIANNVQLILKEESYLDKVNDPANGSYYIENITNVLAKNSWELFQEMEKNGGFISSIENKFIEKEINESADKLKSNYSEGKITLVGVNKFAQEKSESELTIPKFNSTK